MVDDIIHLYGKAIGAFNDKDKQVIIKSLKKSLPRQKPNAYENLLIEINREKANKQAWKKAFVPPYFESIWGKHFLERQREIQDSKKDEEVDAHSTKQQDTQRSTDPKSEKKYIGKFFFQKTKKKPLKCSLIKDKHLMIHILKEDLHCLQ